MANINPLSKRTIRFHVYFWLSLVVGVGAAVGAQILVGNSPASKAEAASSPGYTLLAASGGLDSSGSFVPVNGPTGAPLNDNYAQWLPYGKGTTTPNGTYVPGYANWKSSGYINWPQGKDDTPKCNPTKLKTLPWLGQEYSSSPLVNGDYFPQRGDCSDRFHDGGTATQMLSNAQDPNHLSQGAWVQPQAFNYWADGYPAFARAQLNNTSSNFSAYKSCQLPSGGPQVPVIWGNNGGFGDDYTDYAPQYFSSTNGHSLYSGGTSLIYNKFYMTDTQIASLGTTESLYLEIAADDFFIAYLNGTVIASQYNSYPTFAVQTAPVNMAKVKTLLHSGAPNVLAIQVVDKALWDITNPKVSRGNGVCYGLALEGTSSAPNTDCPPFEGYNTVPFTPSAIVPAASGPAPGSYGTSSVTEEDIDGYQINSVKDEWGQSANWSPPGEYKGSNPTFTLDYTPYVSDYPYDIHNPTVNYTEYYIEKVWVPDSSSPVYSYYCDPGDTLSGTTCTRPDGTTYSAHTTLIGYHYKLSSTTNKSTSADQAATQLPECFDRNFSVDQPTNTQASFTSSVNPVDPYEDPTGVQFTFTTQVHFSLEHGYFTLPLHEGATVRYLTYSPTYYVQRFDTTSNSYVTVGRSTFSTLASCSGSNQNVGLSPVYSPPLPPDDVSLGCSGTARMPDFQPGDRVCFTYKFNYQSGTVDHTGKITSSGSDYDNFSSPTCSAPLHNSPYVKVYGGDVWSGSSFADQYGDCTTSSVGYIYTNTRSTGDKTGIGSAPAPRGSSTQLAAMALSTIDGFSSVGVRTTAPTSATGLTLSNKVSGQPFGGQSGLNSYCAPDYYDDMPSSTQFLPLTSTSPDTASWLGTGKVPAGAWKHSGDLTLNVNNATSVPIGQQTSLYVNGDLYIKPIGGSPNGQIAFDGSNGAWTSTADIPSLRIAVRGNIYIDGNITKLDGVYVAQPSGKQYQGTIYTCTTTDDKGNWQPSLDYDTCNHQLVVTGAFIGQNIMLDRTYASLRNSVAGEKPITSGDCIGNADGGRSTAYTCAAEVFNFSPENYLRTPLSKTIGTGSPMTFDYITDLPPIL